MSINAPIETADDLAARLRVWLDHHADAPELLADMLTRTAAALESVARGDEPVGDDPRLARHGSYKAVLATRGEQHRPDGTPLWPLRPTDFPSIRRPDQAGPAAHAAQTRGADLPDWML